MADTQNNQNQGNQNPGKGGQPQKAKQGKQGGSTPFDVQLKRLDLTQQDFERSLEQLKAGFEKREEALEKHWTAVDAIFDRSAVKQSMESGVSSFPDQAVQVAKARSKSLISGFRAQANNETLGDRHRQEYNDMAKLLRMSARSLESDIRGKAQGTLSALSRAAEDLNRYLGGLAGFDQTKIVSPATDGSALVGQLRSLRSAFAEWKRAEAKKISDERTAAIKKLVDDKTTIMKEITHLVKQITP